MKKTNNLEAAVEDVVYLILSANKTKFGWKRLLLCYYQKIQQADYSTSTLYKQS